ncbi:MAG: hypothetical protein QXX56_05785 [Candidatus Bathyarchaeia archaeon]
MRSIIDDYTLNVTDLSESCEPVGAEWHAWEEGQVVKKWQPAK